VRVLFVSPLSNLRCGERVYGQIWVEELRKRVVIEEWDACYPSCKERGYLPYDRLETFDLVHFNWGPANLGHYLPEHLEAIPCPVSIFLHDVPPNSTCLIQGCANLKMSFEPMEGSVVLPHSVPPRSSDIIVSSTEISVGVTGIRDDPGRLQVKQVCERNGWRYSPPFEEFVDWTLEVERLASNTLNVCWYHTSGRGKSMAAMFCVAARRPLLLSNSSMFSILQPFVDQWEICQVPLEVTLDVDYLEEAIQKMLDAGAYPFLGGALDQAAEALGWHRCARRIFQCWEEVAAR